MSPLLLDDRPYASPVAFGASAGIWTAVRVELPTLEEARSRRLAIPTRCTCGPLECDYCRLRSDHDFTRSQDI